MDNKKEEILKLLQSGVITIDETIEMLKKITNETTTETPVNTTTGVEIIPRNEFEEYIDEIAENAFDAFSNYNNNLENILDIMRRNNNPYLNNPIDYHSIKNIIITNVKSALKYMYQEYERGGKECFGCSCSGYFRVDASYNESDGDDSYNELDGDDTVTINIMFIPYNSYADADLKEMKRLYHKTYSNTK